MPQSKLTRPDGRIVSVRYTMPYDTAKLHTPTTLHSHVEGGVPPSLARNRAARTLMTIPATTKRAAAEVYGGMSSSPSRITSHVLPHTRHMTAMQTFVTTEEGRPWTAWMTWEWGSFSAVIASVSLVRFLHRAALVCLQDAEDVLAEDLPDVVRREAPAQELARHERQLRHVI